MSNFVAPMSNEITPVGKTLMFPGDLDEFIFAPRGMQDMLPENLEEKRKDVIDYMQHMYRETKHVFIFGATGFYGMKFSIEKAFELHGIRIQLDDTFKNLFVGQPPQDSRELAVYVLVSYWFYNFVRVVSTRLNSVTRRFSRFGTTESAIVAAANAFSVPSENIVVTDEEVKFLLKQSGSVMDLNDADIQLDAKDKIGKFVRTILESIRMIPNDPDQQDASQQVIITAEIMVLISTCMTYLILTDLNDRLRSTE